MRFLWNTLDGEKGAGPGLRLRVGCNAVCAYCRESRLEALRSQSPVEVALLVNFFGPNFPPDLSMVFWRGRVEQASKQETT